MRLAPCPGSTPTWNGSTARSADAPDVVGIFPDRSALLRLVGAVHSEQQDEWAEGRRYLGLDVLTRHPHHPDADTTPTPRR